MTKPTRIIRAQHESQYFISTRTAPQDRSLTFEARGMLWYLLSKPDDWTVQPKDLEQQCGHSRVYKLLRELRAAHYLRLIAERDEKKRIIGYIYEVYETPYEETEGEPEPLAEKQQTEKQLPEKQKAENQHITEYRDIQSTDKDSATTSVALVPVNPPRKKRVPIEPSTPSVLMNPMKDKLIALFKFGTNGHKPTKSEWGLVQAAAKQLCDAGYATDDAETIYKYCSGKFDPFGPMALVNHASDAIAKKNGSNPLAGLKNITADESIYAS